MTDGYDHPIADRDRRIRNATSIGITLEQLQSYKSLYLVAKRMSEKHDDPELKQIIKKIDELEKDLMTRE